MVDPTPRERMDFYRTAAFAALIAGDQSRGQFAPKMAERMYLERGCKPGDALLAKIDEEVIAADAENFQKGYVGQTFRENFGYFGRADLEGKLGDFADTTVQRVLEDLDEKVYGLKGLSLQAKKRDLTDEEKARKKKLEADTKKAKLALGILDGARANWLEEQYAPVIAEVRKDALTQAVEAYEKFVREA